MRRFVLVAMVAAGCGSSPRRASFVVAAGAPVTVSAEGERVEQTAVPALARGADRMMVVWAAARRGDELGDHVVGRELTRDGAVAGEPIELGRGHAPDVAAEADTFVVTWRAVGDSGEVIVVRDPFGARTVERRPRAGGQDRDRCRAIANDPRGAQVCDGEPEGATASFRTAAGETRIEVAPGGKIFELRAVALDGRVLLAWTVETADGFALRAAVVGGNGNALSKVVEIGPEPAVPRFDIEGAGATAWLVYVTEREIDPSRYRHDVVVVPVRVTGT